MLNACIIIPCYNEENRLKVDVFLKYQIKHSAFNICFVNDGSIDNTESVISNLAERHHSISCIQLEKNVGKAEAVRQAVLKLHTQYDYLGYLDADLSTPLTEIHRLLNISKTENKLFVLGSRVKVLGTSIKRKFYRHLFGRIVATFIDDFILKLAIYDTQCGAKIIESKLAFSIFKNAFKSKWLFDVELLARTKKQYSKDFCVQNILEVPLRQWHDTSDSRITFLDFLKTPFVLLKLYSHYK